MNKKKMNKYLFSGLVRIVFFLFGYTAFLAGQICWANESFKEQAKSVIEEVNQSLSSKASQKLKQEAKELVDQTDEILSSFEEDPELGELMEENKQFLEGFK